MVTSRHKRGKAPTIVLTLWMCLVFAVSGMMQFIPHAERHHHHHHHHEPAEGFAHSHSHHDHDSGSLHDLDVAHPIEPCCLFANQTPVASKPASTGRVESPGSSKVIWTYGFASNHTSGVPPPKLDALSAYARVSFLLGTTSGPDRTIVLLI